MTGESLVMTVYAFILAAAGDEKAMNDEYFSFIAHRLPFSPKTKRASVRLCVSEFSHSENSKGKRACARFPITPPYQHTTRKPTS
jgi:hypothetical protein